MISERRACRALGQHRSTQRRAATPRADEDAMVGGELLEGNPGEHPGAAGLGGGSGLNGASPGIGAQVLIKV